MATWNPAGYLKFERERTLPCRDLVSKIELEDPKQIADLGCGPGNSTAVLAEKWPNAILIGIDNSPDMLDSAKKSNVRAEWELSDIRKWTPSTRFDLVFSNAALQWVPDHKTEIPRLFTRVSPGGALAFQIPTHTDLWYEILWRQTESSRWKSFFRDFSTDFYTHELAFYYDLMSDRSKCVELWETKYFHVLSGPEAIVDWTKSTGLRPFLERLGDVDTRNEFLREYTQEISKAYNRQPDGKVLFPFLRRFVIAYT